MASGAERVLDFGRGFGPGAQYDQDRRGRPASGVLPVVVVASAHLCAPWLVPPAELASPIILAHPASGRDPRTMTKVRRLACRTSVCTSPKPAAFRSSAS